ncbi:MAG: cadmium-translocating P-type ATPase [Clostridia bacterium]|nr:cadmium-translocating P-type ATPase [Clostridia bacterium]
MEEFVFEKDILSNSQTDNTKESAENTEQTVEETLNLRKSGDTKTFTFELGNLGCPKTAEDIETAVGSIIGVTDAKVNFATTVLTVTVDTGLLAGLIRKINAAIKKIDHNITLKPVGTASRELMRSQPSRREEDRYSFAKKTKLDGILKHLGKKDDQKMTFILLCSSIALTLIALLTSSIGVLSAICAVLGFAAVAIHPAVNAYKTVLDKKFDHNCLVILSSIISICIGNFISTALLMIAYRIYGFVQHWATSRSRKQLDIIKNTLVDEAHLITPDKTTQTVPASSINVGQEIIVRPNERVPLDGVVVEGEGAVNSSDVTGDNSLYDVRPGMVILSGSKNGASELKIRVTSSFENSAATKTYNVLSNYGSEKSEREEFMSKFSKYYTPAVILFGILLTLVPVIFGAKFMDWFPKTLVMFIASAPASLAVTMPLGFFSTMSVCAKNGVLIRNGKYVQMLAESNAIVFSKTGVLTRGDLRVAQIRPVKNMSEEQILTLAAIAESASDHPIARTIKKAAGNPSVPADIQAVSTDNGVKASFSGHTIIAGNARMMAENKIDVSSVGSYTVYVALDSVAVGAIKIADVVRDDIAESVGVLRNLGIEDIILITGDNVQAATEICALCGIESAEHSLNPSEKAEIVTRIAETCGITAYVGEGIDDLAAIETADIGVAMGFESGNDQRDGDAIITSNKVSSFAKCVAICTKALTVIRVNVVIAIAFKLLILLMALVGYADMYTAVVADLIIVILTVLNTTRIARFAKEKTENQ